MSGNKTELKGCGYAVYAFFHPKEVAEYKATQRAAAADSSANDNLARGMAGNAAEEVVNTWAKSVGRTKAQILNDRDDTARNVAEDRPKPDSRRPRR